MKTLAVLALCIAAHAALHKDVVYSTADGLPLTLDAYVPEGKGPFPAAVLVHGGGFVAGDKQQYINYIFKPLSNANFAWFSINYRLAPKYKFPAATEDVEHAIEFVKAHAKEYHVDKKRIALIGESAGGHLVSYVGARNRPESRVAAVVSLYGLHDFTTIFQAWKDRPPEVMGFLGITKIDQESAPILVKASPVTYVNSRMPPFLLIHGAHDEDVPYQQSAEMCEKMKQAGATCELMTVNGVHGMDHWEPHPELHWYKQAMVDWLRTTLK